MCRIFIIDWEVAQGFWENYPMEYKGIYSRPSLWTSWAVGQLTSTGTPAVHLSLTVGGCLACILHCVQATVGIRTGEQSLVETAFTVVRGTIELKFRIMSGLLSAGRSLYSIGAHLLPHATAPVFEIEGSYYDLQAQLPHRCVRIMAI